MKIIFSLLLASAFSAWAADYDPSFNLRHRYNGSTKSLKGRNLSLVHRFQDPRIGLKHYGHFEPNKMLQPKYDPRDTEE